ALLADAVRGRDAKAVEEDLIRIHRLAPHLLDLADLDASSIDGGVEEAEPVRRLAHLVERRGPRQQQHLVGRLNGRNPYFLAIDDITIAVAPGARLQPRGVQPGVRLSDGKTGALLAAREWRQHALLLLVSAEHHDGVESEDVHVDGRCATHPRAGFGDGAHHQPPLEDAEAGSAILLGDADAEPTVLRERGDEFLRKPSLAIPLQPVIVAETAA